MQPPVFKLLVVSKHPYLVVDHHGAIFYLVIKTTMKLYKKGPYPSTLFESIACVAMYASCLTAWVTNKGRQNDLAYWFTIM